MWLVSANCKEVHIYRFRHINPTTLVLALFCSSIPTSLFVLNFFSIFL